MASIPGPVFAIVGLGVSIFSYFVNGKSFAVKSAYGLFMYVGIVIFLYGFAKIIIWFITKESKEEKKDTVKKEIQQAEQQRKQTSVYDEMQKQDFDEDRYKVTVRCQTCGLQSYVYANFCANCGTRLK